ncbi:glycosyltransferase family protein [Saccharopolyspora taberi]|uniref:FkbM family methyltransferase n=1 Tax=Saccharopolyspora taberi TaxID=60895 RepID=A0ABN3V472_9PSEU
MTDSQARPDSVAPGGRESESTLQSGVLEQHAETFGEPEWPAEGPEEQDVAAGTLVGCTVACHGQLPAARVLKDSFLRRHPGAGFVLLLVDQPGHGETGVITPAELGLDPAEFGRLALACTAEQLRGVLRPRLLAHLLESGSTVLYFEPSVQVFGNFDDLLSAVSRDRPVALVPRVLRPLHFDGLRPSAADLAESGTFDPSVFAVRPGAEGLLATWADQMTSDPGAVGMFLDGAPALVDHKVIRDPGVGLSVWNAAQREVVASDSGEYAVDGHPLRSVHFDGFQPQRPWLLSAAYADRPRVLLSEHSVLAGLCANYRNALVAAGYTTQRAHPFDALPDGAVLPSGLRSDYRAALKDGEAPPSPFEPGAAPDEFLGWACEPADDRQREAGASRWTAAVWSDDPVLRRDFPDPFGADADAFHEWCIGVGVASGRVPAAAVHRRAERGRAALVDQLGVAVLGSGRLADLVRAAVGTSGLPSADTPYYPVVLRCEQGVPVPAGRYVIDVGTGAEPSTDVAEVWVPSEAARAEARLSGGPTTRVIALPLPDPGRVVLPSRKGARARHELSDEFVVGAFVDHGDERQDNALGLVNAFLTAFPDRDDVRLVIAVSAAADHPEAAERLRLATAADPRVLLVEDDIDTAELIAASDLVASLHRAESGDRHALRLLEVAAHGVPVLAADHGAVAELFGAEGAKLVPCQGAGEPDIDAAAAELWDAADAPDEIAAFGVRARDHLLDRHNAARAGERLRERVEHAYRNWRTKWAQDRHGHLDDPLRPLLVARHALHRAPDVGVGGRNSMAPALRKAVLKALSHYDEHIRDIMRSMVDGVEQTAAELLRRQYDADGDVDIEALRAEQTRMAQRQDQLDAQLLGTDDGLVRARADLADQHRRLRELEGVGTTSEPVDALAHRLDTLTSAVERTLDRIDALEKNQAENSALRAATHDASHALQRTDVLERILLREHERNAGSGDGTTAPVLCDAGLLRLPADDSLMLPWLSSHASWDSEVSALIDSLLEPDGIFLDVGAYIGYQTVRVLSRLGNSGAVVAVEPCERSRDLLRRNVEVNVHSAWGHRLVVIDGAAWDGPVELAAEQSLAGGVTLQPPAEGTTGTVRGVRLDRELENHAALQNLRLSVVHVDVGARVHRVLGGLVRLLRRDRPSIVCSFTPSAISALGDDPAAALREFGTWGYELVPVGRTGSVTAPELLEAIEAAGSTSTVKLWLRPKGK